MRDNSEHQDNCVWGYEEPCDEVARIASHVALYPDMVDVGVF
ncbi:MAG: DUF427 domain-containing protein [Hyphomicrobiales bacterium]|nr:DUF427 domain-containing protein [Hyphomicrobiales bacterium]